MLQKISILLEIEDELLKEVSLEKKRSFYEEIDLSQQAILIW
jgi:hypothetical protein